MKREEAIANLNHLYGMVSPDIQRSLDVAIKALERPQGKQERPQGDLISREALKEYARKVMCEKDFMTKIHLELFENIIDNAPTVEAYPFEQVQELVKLNQQFAQEIENLKRPQGE